MSAESWRRAVAAVARGDLDETLTCLRQLPPTGYEARITLLLRLAPQLLAESGSERAGQAVAVLTPFKESSLDARALLSVLDPASADDPVEDAVDYAAVVADRCGESVERLRALPLAVRDRQPLPWTPPVSTPSLAAFDAYQRVLAGIPVDGSSAILAALPVPLLDDLIEAKALTPSALAAHRSTWPLLRDAVLAGRLTLDEEVRSEYPDFAAWLDICELARHVYAGNWAEAISRGGDLARSLGDGVVREEAINLAAYAKWQAGRTADAFADLEAATAGPIRFGLLINASVVAADEGSVGALGPLGRLLEHTADVRVQQSLVTRAILLWLADDDAPEYPAALQVMVRGALAGTVSDDQLYLMLVRLCTNHDSAWLAAATIRSGSAAQGDMLHYFQIRARAAQEERAESLRDIAGALVTIWGRDPRPDWLERERDWLTDLLMEGVHTTFGAAVGLTGVIETLAAGGVLPLYYQIVLTAQAGAHVATSLDERDEDIAPETERSLVFAPFHMFLRRRSELPETLAESAADELARCVVVGAVAAMNAVLRDAHVIGEEWDDLVRRKKWDTGNGAWLTGLQQQLLDRLDAGIGRLRMYLSLLSRLPESGPAQKVVPVVLEKVATLAGEAARRRREL